MTTLKKISYVLILCLFAAAILGTGRSVYAAGEYTVLAPLPGTTNCSNNTINQTSNNSATQCKTDFSTYLPAAFNLAIGLAGVLAFTMITYGGFRYMTSDALTGKEEGRGIIENALWGLLLVIGAYVILYTINPQILAFTLQLPTPQIQNQNGVFAVTPGVTADPCTTCQNLGNLNLPFKSGLDSRGIDQTLGTKLQGLNTDLQSANDAWQITEAWPPTINHQDTCHQTGTCVDAAVTNPTAANINNFYASAQKNGLNASFEVQNQATKDQLISQGVTIPITVNTNATGTHFHVK